MSERVMAAPAAPVAPGPTKAVPQLKKPSFKLRKAIHPKPALLLLNELLVNRKPKFEYYDIPEMEKERRAWKIRVL